MTQYIQVATTLGHQETALQMARQLVERRLAACVQVSGPIKSVYRWQGQIETASEWRLAIKSRSDLYPQLEAAIRELHSYQTPEIVGVPLVAGSAAYLAWLDAELLPPE